MTPPLPVPDPDSAPFWAATLVARDPVIKLVLATPPELLIDGPYQPARRVEERHRSGQTTGGRTSFVHRASTPHHQCAR